jgi:hypothetical protein
MVPLCKARCVNHISYSYSLVSTRVVIGKLDVWVTSQLWEINNDSTSNWKRIWLWTRLHDLNCCPELKYEVNVFSKAWPRLPRDRFEPPITVTRAPSNWTGENTDFFPDIWAPKEVIYVLKACSYFPLSHSRTMGPLGIIIVDLTTLFLQVPLHHNDHLRSKSCLKFVSYYLMVLMGEVLERRNCSRSQPPWSIISRTDRILSSHPAS